MHDISPKLFNLAWKKLILDRMDFSMFSTSMEQAQGVFVFDPDDYHVTKKVYVQLIGELLTLPNQYHCYSGLLADKMIWILNNNGTKYNSIDWDKIDIDTLKSDLNRPQFIQAISLFSQYWNSNVNDKTQFLKKVLYFLGRVEMNVNREYYVGKWPRTVSELIVFYVTNTKYHALFDNNPFMIYQIDRIIEDMNINRVLKENRFTLDQMVDFIDQYIPKIEQNVQLNADQVRCSPNWKCLLCDRINDKKTRKSCPSQHGELFNGGHQISSLNPFRLEVSTRIAKPFGIITHSRAPIFKIIDGKRAGREGHIWLGIEFYKEYENIISISCAWGHCHMISIVFYKENPLTVREVEQILMEIDVSCRRNSDSMESLGFSLRSHALFGQMSHDDVINAMSHYHIDYSSDAYTWQRGKKKYKQEFRKQPKKKCQLMTRYLRMNDNNTNNNCNAIDPFKHCILLANGDKLNVEYKENDYDQNAILSHLSECDHFESFDVIQPSCLYKDKCIHYQNILKQSENSTIMDKIHLHIYTHPSNISKTKNIQKQNENKSNNVNNPSVPFKYIDSRDTVIRIQRQHDYGTKYDALHPGAKLLYLLKEVITNGFEDDLLPNYSNNHNCNDNSFDTLEYLNMLISKCKHQDPYLVSEDVSMAFKKEYINFLSTKYKIFTKLQEKIKHERHKKMGYPLKEYEMLAILLYCSIGCNHDLSESQRNGTFQTRWTFFDCFLNDAIKTLAPFEDHYENIYTGMCGVFYSIVDKEKECDRIFFTSNVSFSTDLKIAKECRVDEGLIIGLNMKRSYSAMIGAFRACDVSWISPFPREKEILCERGSMVHVYQYKMTQIGKQQWLVCDEGNLQQTSFQAMFGSN